MRAVGIKALKNKLSEYVRLAAGGETVLVTDRDAVVAELGPPRAGRAAAVGDAVLADAVRRGWIAPPVAAGGVPPAPPVPRKISLDDVLAELRADRDAR
jgi:antitoxin (DNA-binding transcriptional repressor) of toxin-antitoxin stability system